MSYIPAHLIEGSPRCSAISMSTWVENGLPTPRYATRRDLSGWLVHLRYVDAD